MKNRFSAFCVAGTNSGCGKTTVSLSVMSALSRRGLRVAPFKCGPDYIDPSYHAAATGSVSVNLDSWMMRRGGVVESFGRNAAGADVAVLEGVMGLFDGAGAASPEGSTAECARMLGIPVVLVVDASGMAGSIAALVRGYSKFDAGTRICGVIANKVGGESHARILSESLRTWNLPPLLGAIPADGSFAIPERHLGLLPWAENRKKKEFFDALAGIAEECIDIDRVLRFSQIARPLCKLMPYPEPRRIVAVARDDAFTFYYADNIHRMRMAGFDFVEFSPIRDRRVPAGADVLYVGGGFPEIFAKELAANREMRRSMKAFAESGRPVYAECGGLMYLGESLEDSRKRKFPMCGVIPGKTRMTGGRRALGYREVEALHDMPFCRKGAVFRGHEFHWSEFIPSRKLEPLFRCKDSRGRGWLDGIRINNVSASYMHLHMGVLAKGRIIRA